MANHNIFVDTNVLIGAFSGMQNDKECLKYLYSLTGKRLYTSSLSIAQLVSVFQKKKTNQEIKNIVNDIIKKFTVLSFTKADIEEALKSSNSDIEDAIQYVISQKFKCYYFITNNTKDYNKYVNLRPLKSMFIRTIRKD